MNLATRCIAASAVFVGLGLAVTAGLHPGVAMAGPSPSANAAPTGDIIDVATGPGMEKVTTLVTAIKAAGLVEALKGTGPFTVFAPTNEAFAKLPKETLDSLLLPENKDKLAKILTLHVHPGLLKTSSIKDGDLATLNGKKITIKTEGSRVMVSGATVSKTDVMATNGVIHWIDTVLMP
jgi:uncharacterized surface protein with fasciclin (FAS1) repeats